MSLTEQEGTRPSPLRLADVLAALPPERPRSAPPGDLSAAGDRRVVVLDDDPTGTQTVHDVPVVTGWTADDLRWALDQGTTTVYVLTNTRSMAEAQAAEVNREAVANLLTAARALGVEVSVVSRGDSTLRGHFAAEVAAVTDALRAGGERVDGVLFCPAYPEAGRVTVNDEHWIAEDGVLTPVSASHYATDATFAFGTSNLPAYVEERTAGAVRAADVVSIGLEDIRLGGPERVAELLGGLRDARVAVANALDHGDLETLAAGVVLAEEAGHRFVYRTGPSFVRARGAIAQRAPLTPEEVYGYAQRDGRGLVVVGSHVELTTRQVERLEAAGGVARIELDVRSVLDPQRLQQVVDDVASRVLRALAERDVLLVTSRELVRGGSGEASLAIARAVSHALVAVVGQVVQNRELRFLLAKGGITSSDVFTHGLLARRARVLGSLLPGMVSVWQAEDGVDPGLPYVVFAGNVGAEDDLRHAVQVLSGGAPC
jgi:uncharacterized protein YgbK (DUF1537 family)